MDTGSSETRVRTAPSSHPIDPGGFAPGTILADRYRIVALAGRGGMGEVYRADDLKLGQTVALKFLPAGLEHDTVARERLLAEVRSARTVSHPNVCRVYDVGDVSGRVFLTMEYIDGEDLASLLRRIGKLPAVKALEVARQLCAGLAAAHDKGLLHRDLKPANVMIDGRGQARITDFGLAAPAATGESPVDQAGTLAYMAPERFEGKPATVQSDLYALGLILYETYTGKPAFKADTFREWQRAHSDSTPTSPAVLASDVEPAVERAILRCLEKDPTRRPKSAAQVAAALPGGDPLAAAIAAGETPSPELVAASGEEGTLPRWQAWAWLVACLLALGAVPFAQIPFRLAEHVSLNLSPDALRAKAREVIAELGYPEPPADSAWWFRADNGSQDRLTSMKPSEAATELRTLEPAPLLFCYRQSAVPLLPLNAYGAISLIDPTPRAGDVYVELDVRGRLVALRATPATAGKAESPRPVDWTALFAAAHLGPPESFSPATPQWWPENAGDMRDARTGTYGGRPVRVEAAARDGRPIFFRLVLPWSVPLEPGTEPTRPDVPFFRVVSTAFWIAFACVAVLARRNLRLGRADRHGARVLAVAVAISSVGWILLVTDSPSVWLNLFDWPSPLGQPLTFGLFAWLAYLGLEPPVRRAWPQLLVTSTRLLSGRWRDPLVGRALLAGVLVGALFTLPGSMSINRALDLAGGGPTRFLPGELSPYRVFIGDMALLLSFSLLEPLIFLTVLLVTRLAVRGERVAWAVFAVLLVGYGYLQVAPARPGINQGVLLAVVAVFWLPAVWLLRKHGALALAVMIFVSLQEGVPWTLDPSRWYFWQGMFAAALVAALALWGFRSVLGKQSAFPAGALDG